MNKPRKHAEVIKAWADGAEIECRYPTDTYPEWIDIADPWWHDDWEYRVKPQPKSYKMDLWLVVDSNGGVVSVHFYPPPKYGYEDYHVVPHTLEGELPNV